MKVALLLYLSLLELFDRDCIRTACCTRIKSQETATKSIHDSVHSIHSQSGHLLRKASVSMFEKHSFEAKKLASVSKQKHAATYLPSRGMDVLCLGMLVGVIAVFLYIVTDTSSRGFSDSKQNEASEVLDAGRPLPTSLQNEIQIYQGDALQGVRQEVHGLEPAMFHDSNTESHTTITGTSTSNDVHFSRVSSFCSCVSSENSVSAVDPDENNTYTRAEESESTCSEECVALPCSHPPQADMFKSSLPSITLPWENGPTLSYTDALCTITLHRCGGPFKLPLLLICVRPGAINASTVQDPLDQLHAWVCDGTLLREFVAIYDIAEMSLPSVFGLPKLLQIVQGMTENLSPFAIYQLRFACVRGKSILFNKFIDACVGVCKCETKPIFGANNQEALQDLRYGLCETYPERFQNRVA